MQTVLGFTDNQYIDSRIALTDTSKITLRCFRSCLTGKGKRPIRLQAFLCFQSQMPIKIIARPIERKQGEYDTYTDYDAFSNTVVPPQYTVKDRVHFRRHATYTTRSKSRMSKPCHGMKSIK